jgi:hypothetical protein|mmetsp:Transcript_101397/g.196088  ORF Transcript_101397/g.196088 Transcript_101397/m.196088 type:complete len:245 (-) Transcript_101397:433-1167(-)
MQAVQATVVGAPMQQNMDAGDDIFKGAKQLFIQQEFAAIEICSIEAKQRYRISEAQNGKEGTPFLYITEQSDCMERICCSVNRTLTLKVHNGPSADAPVALHFHKPFHCQGCCFCRPEFQIFGPGGKGTTPLGTIKDPCRVCWMDQQVYGPGGEQDLRFSTNGSPWQCGNFCPCCAGVAFNVQKGTPPENIGKIEKLPMDCAELCLKTNRFTVDFGSVDDVVDKKLILASAMLLDLEYFEQNKN